MIELVAFLFFSILSVGLFSVSVFSTNILYAMSSLAGGMIFISGLFFLLGAEFLGVVQILVYVGAVVVLYSFSMMFFDANKLVKENKKGSKTIYTLAVFSALLLFVMVLAPVTTDLSAELPIIEGAGNSDYLGKVVFTKYLIVFEISALMLLVAMIAGIVLVHKDMDKKGDAV